MRSGLTLEQLSDIKGKEFAAQVGEAVELVTEYVFYNRIKELGIQYSPKDLTYTKALLFSWVKEGLESGRKT